MSPIQAVAVAVRLFALWFAIFFGRTAPGYYIQIRDFDDTLASAIGIAVVLLALAFVVFLWFFPRTVARAILPAADPVLASRPSEEAWFRVGCGLLGLWLLTGALPGVARHVFLLYYAQRTQMSLPESSAGTLVYYGTEIAVAAWLLLGGAGVLRLWQWARNRAPADGSAAAEDRPERP